LRIMRTGFYVVKPRNAPRKLAEREGFEPSMEFYVPILP
jgi:hypothetical protein